mmetsp:Transcript_18208/g.48075  ORF Transcript_18208/g.48075 Transcript_18208/m.48075 type:complete len:94 (+) Transcript_18208:295-576(+)
MKRLDKENSQSTLDAVIDIIGLDNEWYAIPRCMPIPRSALRAPPFVQGTHRIHVHLIGSIVLNALSAALKTRSRWVCGPQYVPYAGRQFDGIV